ncbi:MAG TPA: hypothetical protein VF498_20825 [Anaerolineales bacterium]
MKKRLIPLYVALLLATIACSVQGRMSTHQSGDVLFQDNFSNPSSGWDRVKAVEGETNYAQGAYRIQVFQPKQSVWANPGLNFTDVRIEVDAVKSSGPDNNSLGVICRANDKNNFYFFIISSDGYYGIGKFNGQDQALLGSKAMLPSEKILKGEASNHLRADCVGSQLTLYVNGEKIGEAQDSQLSSGDVGLIAGAFDTAGTDISFSHFSVLQP